MAELPFGKGKRWAQGGVAAALLGGWQINALSRLTTGTPVTPVAPGTTLNAPGSGQYADCLGPVEKIGERTRWWDRTNLANPNADVSSGNFGLIGDMQNTGREGNDQRFFRVGVRISF